ncbi:MAG: hypothetical protein HQL07_07175 [Nitrospirae bacterium]|nr:hypothetical protein [Magnetococcales bacterium]
MTHPRREGRQPAGSVSLRLLKLGKSNTLMTPYGTGVHHVWGWDFKDH